MIKPKAKKAPKRFYEEIKKEEPAKPEVKDANSGKEGIEALKDLNINLDAAGPAGSPPLEDGADRGEAPKGQGPQITSQQEIEQLTDTVIGMADSLCTSKGLTPLNPVQKIILRTGLIGTAMKYNISFDKYPEIMLIGGGIWVIADKAMEKKNLNPISDEPERKEAEKEPEPIINPNDPANFDKGRE